MQYCLLIWYRIVALVVSRRLGYHYLFGRGKGDKLHTGSDQSQIVFTMPVHANSHVNICPGYFNSLHIEDWFVKSGLKPYVSFQGWYTKTPKMLPVCHRLLLSRGSYSINYILLPGKLNRTFSKRRYFISRLKKQCSSSFRRGAVLLAFALREDSGFYLCADIFVTMSKADLVHLANEENVAQMFIPMCGTPLVRLSLSNLWRRSKRWEWH